MSVHLDDYQELLEGLSPEERERLDANWPAATRAFSPRGIDNYLKGAAALKGLGRGPAMVLAWIEQAPQVSTEVGEDVVGELARGPVPPVGLLVQSLAHDPVDVALEPSNQPFE